MKKIIFTLLICVSAWAVKAQIGYNYLQYDVGLSAGFNSPHTDFKNGGTSYSAIGHFTYNYTPYLNYIAEVQAGSIKGDNIEALFPGSAYSYHNNFTAVAFRAQLQMGEIMDYSRNQLSNFIKNIYISSGVGVIYTDLKVADTGIEAFEAKGSNIYIPIKAGYEFKLFNNYDEPVVKVDVGYQYNYIFSDDIDGITIGRSDAIKQFVIGFKFGIGGSTSYRKAITY